MNQSQLLMYEVIKERYNNLIKKVIAGEWLSVEEREEIGELSCDVCKIEGDMVLKFGDMMDDLKKEAVDSNNKVINTLNMMEEMEELMNKVNDSLIEANDRSKMYSHLYGLAEHFIVNNELEDQYIEFLNNIARNETVEEYHDAAKYILDLYRVDNDFYLIEDEYYWMKEEEETGGFND